MQLVNGKIPPTDRFTDPPKQACRLTGELIMIGAGKGVTVTGVTALVAEQILASVTVTEYEPLTETIKFWVVAVVFQT